VRGSGDGWAGKWMVARRRKGDYKGTFIGSDVIQVTNVPFHHVSPFFIYDLLGQLASESTHLAFRTERTVSPATTGKRRSSQFCDILHFMIDS
jgi:hypothetical protein